MDFEQTEDAWRKALEDAADYLEQNNWVQGQSQRRSDGAVSMLGALATVCVYSKPYTRSLNELKHLTNGDPNDWNDQPGRTKEEVIAKLREASGHPPCT